MNMKAYSCAGLIAAALAATITILVSGCSSGTQVGLPQIASFTATGNPISNGGSSTLSWAVINATTIGITGTNEITGATTTLTLGSGDDVVVSPAATTTYTLTATDSAGSVTAKVSVSVNNVASNLNCTTGGTLYTVNPGNPTVVKVASAANFTSPLLFWLNNYFLSSTVNPNYAADVAAYTMDVCSDSTGNFESAIAAGTYVPNIFFAADTSNKNASYTTESMEYAQGYPILLGYLGTAGKGKSISAITDLIQGETGTFADINATIASGNLANYHLGTLITNNTASTGTLIANPTLAPYGAAAENILNSMLGANTVTMSSYPSWLRPPASYSSITKAFNAIGNDAYTGFAAFSQICTSPPTGAVWVRFTGSDVLTIQEVANLEHNPGGGTEIYNLITAEMNDSNHTWLKYITANYGYGSCYAGI